MSFKVIMKFILCNKYPFEFMIYIKLKQFAHVNPERRCVYFISSNNGYIVAKAF